MLSSLWRTVSPWMDTSRMLYIEQACHYRTEAPTMPGPGTDCTQWLVFLRQQVPLAGREPGWLWSAGMEAWVKPPWGGHPLGERHSLS